MESASFDIGCILVCLTIVVNMVLYQRRDKLQSKLFIALVLNIAVTALCDVITTAVITYYATASLAELAVNCTEFVHYALHTAMTPLFFIYALVVSREATTCNPLRNHLMALPFYVSAFITLTNPITHWMFTVGPDLLIERSWGMYVLYVVGALYFTLGFIQLHVRWHALTSVKRRALAYFFLVSVVGVIIQLSYPHSHVELFAESLTILGIMMFVENEEDLIDSECGVYNRHALQLDLDSYAKVGHHYYIIAVRVVDTVKLAHLGGSALMVQFIAEQLVSYLTSVMPWYHVYRTAPARFLLADPQMSYEKASEIAYAIADRFEQSWRFNDIDVNLRAAISLACVPDELPTSDDVFYLIDSPASAVAGKGVMMGSDLNYLVRRAEVEHAVRRGFNEGEYEVFFQPVCRSDGKVYAAEALMRLNDRVLGNVSPDEFIETAERMGVVEEIGEFALREVCAFFASGIPQQLGIEHVSVNLSVAQCMQVDFAEHVNEVVAQYGIDPESVIFEITESVTAGNNELLGKMMGQLKQSGHRFAMDDFGTGYSNMHSLAELDFEIVKIDKSVLWDAEKNEMGKAILQNSVNMMRDVGCEVLVEGVETINQEEMLRNLGVDYFQGFLFARPMPKAEFVSYVKSTR